MLPAKPNFFRQDEFILHFLDEYFSKFNSEKIYLLAMLGNDEDTLYRLQK